MNDSSSNSFSLKCILYIVCKRNPIFNTRAIFFPPEPVVSPCTTIFCFYIQLSTVLTTETEVGVCRDPNEPVQRHVGAAGPSCSHPGEFVFQCGTGYEA